MILKTAPHEIPRLKRYDQLFQDVTWIVIITAYLFSWFPQPQDITINRFGVSAVVIVAVIAEFIAYKIIPFDKSSGAFKYSYKLKALFIGISNHFLISAYIIFTGGAHSPFIYLYSLPLVAAAVYLPLWAILAEFTTVLVLYPVSSLIVAPIFGYTQIEFWHFYQIPINLAGLAFIISLTYPQAKEIADESLQNLKLAEKIRGKSAEFEAERNKLKVIISAISDGVVALDQNARVILVNEAAEKITNLAEAEILEKPFDEVLQIYEGAKKISSLELLPIQPKKDLVVFTGRDLKLKSSKKEAFVNLISTTIKEANLVNLGCILTFQDVTAEKQLEEMKLDFVSMAVHELRTPLTTLRGYIQLIEEEAGKKLTKQEKQDLQKIKNAAKQLASLIDNLLNVSRIERGVLKLDITPCNWAELVEKVISDFLELAKEKGLKLTFIKPKGVLSQVAVDKFRISEVLSNLLSNAVNFTKEGEIKVRVKRLGDEIVTQVSDTGPGIPQSAIPNLFTKFFRVKGILEQGSKGTGLGLFIAKSIVEDASW